MDDLNDVLRRAELLTMADAYARGHVAGRSEERARIVDLLYAEWRRLGKPETVAVMGRASFDQAEVWRRALELVEADEKPGLVGTPCCGMCE